MRFPAAARRSLAVTAGAVAALTACVIAPAAVTACSAGGTAAAHRPGPDGRAGQALADLRTRNRSPRFYLSLGDSLARGVQPGPDGLTVSTGEGYPDQLAAMLRRHGARLQLIRLGCSGETTVTMIHGGVCRYQAGSQLGEAVRVLRARAGQVALITIDIGANDPNSCVLSGSLSRLPACLYTHAAAGTRNLATILSRLRSAAGRRAEIVGMTYYVPELAEWLLGRAGAELAVISERLVTGYDLLLARLYRRYGARVADVFAAFHSADFGGRARLARRGEVPRNVAAVCALTWMCAGPPRGPDEHANAAGYRIIARAFWRAISA